MNKKIEDILTSLPHSPGVYQYFNVKWEIIYVGKSKNLKSRVNSYFSGQQKLNFAKKKMVWLIEDIQYIVTNNEVESLILENDLIKKYQPKYNILLKDDKNFLYIKITKALYPQVIRTRISPSKMKVSDGKYFGPYISGYHVSEVFKILKKIYGYWVGPHNFFKKKWSYSLDKYIFDGNVQLSEEQTQKLYRERIEEMKKFLSWDTAQVKQQLKNEMLEFAANKNFEEAQKRKLQLESLESLWNSQVVRDGVQWDYYVIQVLEKYDSSYVWVIEIRDSHIVWYETSELKNELEISKSEILSSIIEQKWVDNRENSQLVFLVPQEVDIRYPEIQLEIPQIWGKFELLKLCYKNIYEYAHKKYIDSLSTKAFSKQTMQNLLKALWYSEVNSQIIFECNDISHLSGTHTVASRSVIENGKKNTKLYKKFRVKQLDQWKIDDFWSMREIMTRRIWELQKIWNYPDLVIIDWGKWQLWAVMEVLEEKANPEILEKLQIVSIAKREEELFLPGESSSIILDKDSSELRLIQALRDEAHRFAITFNRDSRIKSQKKNILESIPGIWPKTQLEEVLGVSVTENLENHGLV